jgi:hypothetical protein
MLSRGIEGSAQIEKTKTKKRRNKITMKNYKTSLAIAALASAGFAQVAMAVPPPVFPGVPGLYLYDEATGASAFVANGVNNFANFTGTVGDYSVNVQASGITEAGGIDPILDLDVAHALAGAGATFLDVYYSDGSFGPTSGGYTLSTGGPATGGPIVSSAFLGGSVFSQTTPLGGSTDVAPFTINATGAINASSYFLTLEDHISGSEVSVDTTLTVVPESTTVIAAALMLLPLGIGAVRSLRKEQTA